MSLNDKIINFDINRNNLFNLTAKQYDTDGARSFTFRLLKNSVPFSLEGLSVKVGGKKPDGKNVFNDCIIKDAKKGIVEVELTTQMQVTAGTLNLELIMFKGETRLSTIPFEVQIIQSATCYSEIQSSDEFGTLQNAINTSNEYADKLKQGTEKIELQYANKLNEAFSQLSEKMDKNVLNDAILSDKTIYSSNKVKELIETIPKGEKGEPGTASVAIDDDVINTTQTWSSKKIRDYSEQAMYFYRHKLEGDIIKNEDKSINVKLKGQLVIFNRKSQLVANTYPDAIYKIPIDNFLILDTKNKTFIVAKDTANLEGDANYIILLYNQSNGRCSGILKEILGYTDDDLNFVTFNENLYYINLDFDIDKSVYGSYSIKFNKPFQLYLLNSNNTKYSYVVNTNEQLTTKNTFNLGLYEKLVLDLTDKKVKTIAVRDEEIVLKNKYIILLQRITNGGICDIAGLFSDYYMQKEINNNFKRLESNLDNTEKSDNIPAYYKEHLKEKIKEVRDLVETNSNSYCFGYISDSHIDWSSKHSGYLLNEIDKYCTLSTIIHTGDIIYQGSTKEEVVKMLRNGIDMFNPIKDKMLFSIGNHDSNSSSPTDVFINNDELYSICTRRSNEVGNLIYPKNTTDKTFYYYDDKVNKVRYLCLNTCDKCTNEKMTFGVSQEQFDFLVNQVLKFDEEGWDLVIFAHHPLPISPYSGVNNQTAFINVIKAYNNKTQYTFTANIDHPYHVDLNYDFRNDNGKRCNVIGWFAGHEHRDLIGKFEGINAFTNKCDTLLNYSGMTPERVKDTITEHAFCIVIVNKKTSKINIVGIGACDSFYDIDY